jgi:hypothetical protein
VLSNKAALAFRFLFVEKNQIEHSLANFFTHNDRNGAAPTSPRFQAVAEHGSV